MGTRIPDEEKRCTAHSKSTGERCKSPVVPGRTVCRIHGGLTPVGPAASQYKHGRYSKYAPARLRERYEQGLEDTELLSLRDEIALMDGRIGEVLGRVDTGESGALWQRLGQAWLELTRAQRVPDAEARGRAMAEALNTIGEVITKGQGDQQAWAEVVGLWDSRRKLVESERKRLIEMQQMITVEQGMVLITQLQDILTGAVRKHCDAGIAARILAETSVGIAQLTERAS